jgi:hypothetical protein
MLYICDVCPRIVKGPVKWLEHCNTIKHKNNLLKATHICLKCNSCFIYEKNSLENKEKFETHMEKCKKNIIDDANEKRNDNDLTTELREEIMKLKKEIDTNNLIKENFEKTEKENILLKNELTKLKGENKFLIKLEIENLEFKKEIKELRDEIIKVKGDTKLFNKIEKENAELKQEIKEFKHENKLLNDKLQKVLTDAKSEVKQVMEDSNNKIEESKKDIIKICGKQIDFAQNVSKDSNKITSSAMTLLGFLQKQCPNAPPLLEFNNENYEYTFTFDEDFVYDILYAFDNDTIGEFIGKIINAIFLKDNKENQSLFATDCVRLNYSIKEYINETKNKWTLDKGANKVKNIIINPLLLYFIKELKLHLQKENNKMMLAGTRKSNDYIDSDKENKKIEYDMSKISDSDDSEEGWRSPKEISDDEDDYMLKSIKKNITKPLNVSKSEIENPYENPDKIKNPNKYHKELTIKERDSIINQSTKIVQFIKAIEDGIITKEVLKFITKFYQLDKSYFE